MPQRAMRVGVFVNADRKEILQKAESLGLNMLQLHGNESPQLCRQLTDDGYAVIKAFSIKTPYDMKRTADYEGTCRYFLFDTPCPGYGGSGKRFDWDILSEYKGNTPFLLSGGLKPNSLPALAVFSHPKWAGDRPEQRLRNRSGSKRCQCPKIIYRTIKKLTTMNRINQLFSEKKHDILSLYFCAGSPNLDGTANVIRTLEQKGIDMIEIGIPFSDPMADGPVIQDAATQALRNGMTLRKLFSQLKDIRKDTHLPLILMGYLNPIMQYGFEDLLPELQGMRHRRNDNPRPSV